MALGLIQRKHSVLAQTPLLLNPIVSRAIIPFKGLRSTQGNSPPHLNGGSALTQCLRREDPGLCVKNYQDTGRINKMRWLALWPELTISRGLQSPIPTLTKFLGKLIFDHRTQGCECAWKSHPGTITGSWSCAINTSILVKCKNSRLSHL